MSSFPEKKRKEEKKKLWFVAVANFHGINTLIVANFKQQHEVNWLTEFPI